MITVPLAMFGFIPFGLLLFNYLPARRALIIVIIVGTFFLPNATYIFSGLPDYRKVTAIALTAVMGVALFDFSKIANFRFRLIDFPMLVFCFCPIATSLHNSLGLYNGLSGALSSLFTWGFAYFIGRMYFNSYEAIKELVYGLLVVGVVFSLLCLWEVKMSPQLHTQLYGFFPHSFLQQWRAPGVFRPVVFFNHGIQTSLWLAILSTLAFSAWYSRAIRSVRGIPIFWCLVGFVIALLFTRTLTGVASFGLGATAFYLAARFKKQMGLFFLCLIVPLYLVARISLGWDALWLVEQVETYVGPQRASSLKTRVVNEQKLVERVDYSLLFGVGTWGRINISEEGETLRRLIQDSMWMIMLSSRGLVGVCSLFFSLTVPPLMALRALKRQQVSRDKKCLALGIIVSVLIINLNMLFNTSNYFIVTAMLGAVVNISYMVGSEKPVRSNREKLTVQEPRLVTRFI